jgi:hypothetical protein
LSEENEKTPKKRIENDSEEEQEKDSVERSAFYPACRHVQSSLEGKKAERT